MSVQVSKNNSQTKIQYIKQKTDSCMKLTCYKNLQKPAEIQSSIKYKSTLKMFSDLENQLPILNTIKSIVSNSSRLSIQSDNTNNTPILDMYNYNINDVDKFDEQLDGLSSISDFDLEKDENQINDSFDSCCDEDNKKDDVEKIVIFSKSRTYHFIN